MDTPKFVIEPKKYSEESTIISMRLPKDMLRDIDKIAKLSGRTRNEILTLGMEFAIENLQLGEEEK